MYLLNKNAKFIFKKVKGESVMLNSETGDYFGLNKVGTDFISLVDGAKDIDMIIKQMIKIYDVDEEILRKDIRVLVDKMIEKNILIKSRSNEV